ncbi:MAG: non-hydrolyzing UDP-N-acetylglucosamine 2-epimerase [Verrucomicrobiota bacterium]
MKILTLFGTRPEIIRLSLIIQQIDQFAEQILVHTGQNYDPNLSQLFLDELNVRKLDRHLGIQAATFGEQAGQILAKMDDLLAKTRPDRLLVLGDTNSGLAAIVAARKGIPVYHLEAGNRCYDNRVPEEVNRRIIDHSSDVLLPYTQRSAENLVAEGIRRERIFVVGNPILEVIENFTPRIDASQILGELNLKPGGYFIATMHRAENVDLPERLETLLGALSRLADEFQRPVVLSVHPRTADRIAKANIKVDSAKIILRKPFGLFDFVHLEKNSFGVVTDSGTVQEEACIFGIPNVTIRDVTERPETTECGSNILAGANPELLVKGMKLAIAAGKWNPPVEYVKKNVAATVAKIVLSFKL